MSILVTLNEIDFDGLLEGDPDALSAMSSVAIEIIDEFTADDGTIDTAAIAQAGLEVGATVGAIHFLQHQFGGEIRDVYQSVDHFGSTGTMVSAENVNALREAIVEQDVGAGITAFTNLVSGEQDGFVVGMQNGEIAAGFQEQTITEERDASGNVVSGQTFTFGVYADSDLDAYLQGTIEGFENFGNGSELSYSAVGSAGTDGLEGRGVVQWTQDTDWGSYGALAGGAFQIPADGSEVDYSAAVLGEATYDNFLGNEWGIYAFGEGGVVADPHGVDPIARVGIGRDTAIGDIRAGVTQNGGFGFTIGTSF